MWFPQLVPPNKALEEAGLGLGWVVAGTRPSLNARCGLQCLVWNRVGEDFFVSLVEGDSGVTGIVHRCRSAPLAAAAAGQQQINRVDGWMSGEGAAATPSPPAASSSSSETV